MQIYNPVAGSYKAYFPRCQCAWNDRTRPNKSRNFFAGLLPKSTSNEFPHQFQPKMPKHVKVKKWSHELEIQLLKKINSKQSSWSNEWPRYWRTFLRELWLSLQHWRKKQRTARHCPLKCWRRTQSRDIESVLMVQFSGSDRYIYMKLQYFWHSILSNLNFHHNFSNMIFVAKMMWLLTFSFSRCLTNSRGLLQSGLQCRCHCHNRWWCAWW